jgi:hypothetical protein
LPYNILKFFETPMSVNIYFSEDISRRQVALVVDGN